MLIREVKTEIPGLNQIFKEATTMAGNRLTIKLTDDQQKQIKDATGKSVTELHVSPASSGDLSEQDLDKVAGGIIFVGGIRRDAV